MGTLKTQSNGPLYRNTVIRTLAVDGGLLHLVQRGWGWAGCSPAQSPPCCITCSSPPINGQCTKLYYTTKICIAPSRQANEKRCGWVIASLRVVCSGEQSRL